MKTDEYYMEIALKEAQKAYLEDEVPIGCVIVKDDRILSKAHNRKEKKKCSVFHSEIEAIQKACKKIDNWHLDGCVLYVTLEPCMMCTGAIVQSRISKVVFGTRDPKGGAFVSNIHVKEVKGINHYPDFEEGILQEKCSQILKDYFKSKRSSANDQKV